MFIVNLQQNTLVLSRPKKTSETQIVFAISRTAYLMDRLTIVRILDLNKLNLVKIRNGGLVLSSSQFPLLPQLPQKMTLDSKFVINDSKTIILLC